MCTDMCIGMRTNMCICMCTFMFTDMCIDIVHTCVWTCVQTCAYMCIEHMYRCVHGHVYRHGSGQMWVIPNPRKRAMNARGHGCYRRYILCEHMDGTCLLLIIVIIILRTHGWHMSIHMPAWHICTQVYMHLYTYVCTSVYRFACRHTCL